MNFRDYCVRQSSELAATLAVLSIDSTYAGQKEQELTDAYYFFSARSGRVWREDFRPPEIETVAGYDVRVAFCSWRIRYLLYAMTIVDVRAMFGLYDDASDFRDAYAEFVLKFLDWRTDEKIDVEKIPWDSLLPVCDILFDRGDLVAWLLLRIIEEDSYRTIYEGLKGCDFCVSTDGSTAFPFFLPTQIPRNDLPLFADEMRACLEMQTLVRTIQTGVADSPRRARRNDRFFMNAGVPNLPLISPRVVHTGAID